MNKRAFAAALAVCGMGLGAFAHQRPAGPEMAAVRHPAPAAFRAQATPPKQTGRQAPDFSLKDLEGKTVSLSQYRGKKVVILDFWATWCGPCRMVMPQVESYAAKHPQDVALLSINQKEDRERVASFVRNHGMPAHVLMDMEGEVSEAYRVYGLPTLFIIDKQGVLRFRHIGFRPDLESQLEKAIAPMLEN